MTCSSGLNPCSESPYPRNVQKELQRIRATEKESRVKAKCSYKRENETKIRRNESESVVSDSEIETQ